MEAIDRARPEPRVAQEANEVVLEFSTLRANDFIVICTRNSTYGFLVTDPVEMRGKLMDCAHGHDESEAVLAGIIFRQGRTLCPDNARLKTQSRALFLFPIDGDAKKLLTSAIIKLVCVRNVADGLA